MNIITTSYITLLQAVLARCTALTPQVKKALKPIFFDTKDLPISITVIALTPIINASFEYFCPPVSLLFSLNVRSIYATTQFALAVSSLALANFLAAQYKKVVIYRVAARICRHLLDLQSTHDNLTNIHFVNSDDMEYDKRRNIFQTNIPKFSEEYVDVICKYFRVSSTIIINGYSLYKARAFVKLYSTGSFKSDLLQWGLPIAFISLYAFLHIQAKYNTTITKASDKLGSKLQTPIEALVDNVAARNIDIATKRSSIIHNMCSAYNNIEATHEHELLYYLMMFKQSLMSTCILLNIPQVSRAINIGCVIDSLYNILLAFNELIMLLYKSRYPSSHIRRLEDCLTSLERAEHSAKHFKESLTQPSSDSKVVLSIENFRMQLGKLVFLIPQFKLQKGEAALISTESGSGKSSILTGVAYGVGFQKADKVECSSIYMSAQSPIFDPDKPLWQSIWRNKTDITEDALVEFKKLNLSQSLLSYQGDDLGKLSGGEKQRLAFLQAMNSSASVIFLDEPFNALDASIIKTMVTMIETKKQNGKAFVIIEHKFEGDYTHFKDYNYEYNIKKSEHKDRTRSLEAL